MLTDYGLVVVCMTLSTLVNCEPNTYEQSIDEYVGILSRQCAIVQYLTCVPTAEPFKEHVSNSMGNVSNHPTFPQNPMI